MINYGPWKQISTKSVKDRAIRAIDLDIADIHVKELLLPKTEEELAQYLVAVKRLQRWESSRQIIMKTQRHLKLPLRPNMTPNEVRVQILLYKKKNGTDNEDFMV